MLAEKPAPTAIPQAPVHDIVVPITSPLPHIETLINVEKVKLGAADRQ